MPIRSPIVSQSIHVITADKSGPLLLPEAICRATTAATPPSAAARALWTNSNTISPYTATKITIAAVTDQLGISSGADHVPLLVPAAETEKGMTENINNRDK